ncbi:MAG: thiamine diphosphokinase [Synergistaceae bacterium]|jgi:thiamine pyrophosphokinase|nr:thiamine diphosphokinase [Synergistaceae bacterium]
MPELRSERVDFYSGRRTASSKALLVLAGRAPDSRWLSDFAAQNELMVCAVDRGVAVCRKADLAPAFIAGDRDSASPEDWDWALGRGAEEFLFPADKNLTDFQLALEIVTEKNRGAFVPLVLTGCFGGRFDHLFSIVNTFSGESALCMIDETEGLFFVRPEGDTRAVFKKRPAAVSLLPLSGECSGVHIGGVRWPLDGVKLTRAYPWAVSNETPHDRDEVSVGCERGTLGFYWSFNAS